MDLLCRRECQRWRTWTKCSACGSRQSARQPIRRVGAGEKHWRSATKSTGWVTSWTAKWKQVIVQNFYAMIKKKQLDKLFLGVHAKWQDILCCSISPRSSKTSSISTRIACVKWRYARTLTCWDLRTCYASIRSTSGRPGLPLRWVVVVLT